MSKSIRIDKRRGYTVIPNGLLPEGKITARAWGIYAYLLSRPDGWVIHVRQLQKVFKEGREAIYTALRQLREAGLLEMESYKEPGQPPKQRFILADLGSLLANLPDAGFRDTANRDAGSRDLNQYLLKPELTESNKNNNHPPSSAGDYSTSEQSSDARHFTSNSQANMTREDILPKEHWKHLRSKLQAVGKAIEQTGSFHSEQAQQEWEGFMSSLELVTDHLPYSWAIVDLTQNGKWTVNAKVAAEYEAGKELLTLLNTARKEG